MRASQAISVFLLALATALAAKAQGDEPPPWRMEVAYASRYVFRGVDRAGDSVQATAELGRENFRGGLWVSQPFRRGEAREVNVNATYVWPATESFTLEASVAHAWFSEVPGGGMDRSCEAGLTATLAPVAGFTPGLAYHRDFHLRADTVQASVARSIALTRWGAFLELNFFAGWADGDDWRPGAGGSPRHDGYGYWGGEAHLPYRVGPHSTVVAGLHYADTFGRSAINGPFGRSSSGNLWITVGVSLDF